MSNKHNGWTNYETWTVIVNIDNTLSLYNFYKDAVREVKEKFPEDKRMEPIISILKNMVNGMKPNTNNNIWGPLINATYESINFPEIARNLLEDY